jgi:hypothetical protein
MITPNEFWLSLHQLAEAYRAEGMSHDERLESVADEFQRLPLTVRHQVLVDLHFTARHLSDVYKAVAPLVRRAEEVQHSAG